MDHDGNVGPASPTSATVQTIGGQAGGVQVPAQPDLPRLPASTA